MKSLFGLSLFLSFIVTGIWLGHSQRPLTLRLVVQVLVVFTMFYVGMGLILSVNTDFLIPH